MKTENDLILLPARHKILTSIFSSFFDSPGALRALTGCAFLFVDIFGTLADGSVVGSFALSDVDLDSLKNENPSPSKKPSEQLYLSKMLCNKVKPP